LWRKVKRARQRKFWMLATHGKGLEAPQYSGREVDAAHWRCPFHK